MRPTLLAALCGIVLLRAPAPAQEPHAPYPRLPWAPTYFADYDAAARIAGLPVLRTRVLPPGERETRIWVQLEVAVPRLLYRFHEQGGRVQGERILYWPAPTGGKDEAEIRRRYGGACASFAAGERMLVCRSRFTAAPDWAAVLRGAEREGLRALPDPSTLPDDGIRVLDGWTMTVELREGAWYRTYRYATPEEHPRWPSAARASAVLRTLHEVDARAVRAALP